MDENTLNAGIAAGLGRAPAPQRERPPERRRNAGQIKSNLPMIITGGKKRYDDFHYQFTEKGKISKRPQQGTYNIGDPRKNPGVLRANSGKFLGALRYKCPRNFCPDCNRTDRPHEMGRLNMIAIDEPEPHIDIRPGEVIVTVQCQECGEWADTGKEVCIMGNDEWEPETIDPFRREKLRNDRMKRNTYEYIKARILANDAESIMLSLEQRRALGHRD